MLTYEQFTGSNIKTPEKVKEYIEYLKKNGKEQWTNKK
jgi:hypothetical protein